MVEDIQEEWKPVVGFEGVYEVSSLGNLRRIIGGGSARAGRLLKPVVNRYGYLQTVFRSPSGIRKNIVVHRLVARAFLGQCPAGFEVNHLDGNKQNNTIENLEYVTASENSRHAVYHSLRGTTCKLTPALVRQIRSEPPHLRSKWLAEQYGVSPVTVSHIRAGRRWGWLL